MTDFGLPKLFPRESEISWEITQTFSSACSVVIGYTIQENKNGRKPCFFSLYRKEPVLYCCQYSAIPLTERGLCSLYCAIFWLNSGPVIKRNNCKAQYGDFLSSSN